ncbi:MAG TPA: cytochrome c biogenesis protein CcdA [Acidimicrobiales bacterium]|nr:cytochrome c biogenesis protein CcdA [Acidimicrobiales bacterium]
MFLILVSIVAGMIAGISPCVLPVLPVVLVAGATNTSSSSSWRRGLSIVLGLIVSFSVLILAGTEIVSLFHLPETFLRDLGIGLLIVIGIGLLFPQLGHILERPFSRFVTRQPKLSRSGFVIGLALGLVFVPCAGPVLSTIIVLGARERVNFMTVLVTVAFSIGAAVPLLIVALAGSAIMERARSIREHGPVLRRVGGVVLIGMAIAISTNVFNSLQTDLPGYTSALQQHVEGSSTVHKELQTLKPAVSDGRLADCVQNFPTLQQCGPAPNFADVTKWLNTPDGKPISIQQLKGKVVLVDFWTYSCINCERALPHVEAWYNRYKSDGLVVVGVHTPEFNFEHVVSNVESAAKSLHVNYPVDVDDNYATWDAYQNDSWPADYLVAANGEVRHVGVGEGDYSLTERFIRQLLVKAHPGIKLPSPTSVANLTPTQNTSPESYVGYQRIQYEDNVGLPTPNVATKYVLPSSLGLDYFAFAGIWNVHAKEATAGSDAAIELSYQDQDVYLVMGGTGTVEVSAGNGTPPSEIHIDGIPKLYTLLHSKTTETGTMLLHFSPGVEAYDFTFG